MLLLETASILSMDLRPLMHMGDPTHTRLSRAPPMEANLFQTFENYSSRIELQCHLMLGTWS